MKHLMKLQKEPFEKIKNGSKSIELRLYDNKRKLIKIGDIIIFTLIGSDDSISVKVIDLHLFDSFKSLYEKLPLTKCGYADVSRAHFEDMEKYYSKEEQALYGVVGIEIELVKEN